MRKHVTILCGIFAAMFCGNVAMAQGDAKVNLRLEARGDVQYENIGGHTIDGNTGFRGQQLNLRLNGSINDSWSYVYRQRMGKPNGDASYFNAVDHINLTYTTGAWAFTGGKQSVAVGGYEYDRAPIDFYFGSEYWYSMACYQWGVNVRYAANNETNDAVTLQVVQSPFRGINPSMLSYNLMWTCSYGWVDYLHSINMLEYQPGKYIYYLALGYQFKLGDFTLQLDFMERYSAKHNDFDDYSVMADLSWSASDKLKVFGKYSFDMNDSNYADYCVLPGTKLNRVGAGVEYFPIEGSRNVRLHGTYSYAWGKNGNSAGSVWNNHSFVSLGVTWKMSILNR